MMKIDELYHNYNKEEFYLGRVSQVTLDYCLVQAENLTLLQTKIISNQEIFPKTINYLVVINDERGIFLGKVIKSQIRNTTATHDALLYDDRQHICPELTIKIVGLLQKNQFRLPNNNTVGLTNKVYIATSEITKLYLDSFDLIYRNYSHDNILDDVAIVKSFGTQLQFSTNINTIFDRHLLIVGATNSGKSTSALRILEEARRKNKKFILIDPTGEYHQSFSKCENVESIDLGNSGTIDPGKIKLNQWKTLFQTNENSQGPELMQAINELKFQYKHGKNKIYPKLGRKFTDVEMELNAFEIENDLDNLSFNQQLLESQIIADSVKLANYGKNEGKYINDSFIRNTNEWLIQKIKYIRRTTKIDIFFNNDPNKNLFQSLDEFLENNKSLYVDISTLGSSDIIGSFIIDIISEYLFETKTVENKGFFIYIDEAHRYLRGNDTLAMGLENIAREGRKKGIFLFLTSQSPKDVPDTIVSQIGSVIVHRLTSEEDIYTLRNYLSKDAIAKINSLNKGEAVLSSINLLENLFLKFNKSTLPHSNNTQLL